MIGNGTVVNLTSLLKELDQLNQKKIDYKGRLFLSDRAHLITKFQINRDAENEKSQNIGTTKKGIGPTYSDKINRYGLRVGDLNDWGVFVEKFEKMASFYKLPIQTEEMDEFRRLRDILVQ